MYGLIVCIRKLGQTGTFHYVTRESIVLSKEFSVLFNETAYKSKLYSRGKKCSIQKKTMNSKHCKKIRDDTRL